MMLAALLREIADQFEAAEEHNDVEAFTAAINRLIAVTGNIVKQRARMEIQRRAATGAAELIDQIFGRMGI